MVVFRISNTNFDVFNEVADAEHFFIDVGCICTTRHRRQCCQVSAVTAHRLNYEDSAFRSLKFHCPTYSALPKCLHCLPPIQKNTALLCIPYICFLTSIRCCQRMPRNAFCKVYRGPYEPHNMTRLKVFNVESSDYRRLNFDLVLYHERFHSEVFQFAPPHIRCVRISFSSRKHLAVQITFCTVCSFALHESGICFPPI